MYAMINQPYQRMVLIATITTLVSACGGGSGSGAGSTSPTPDIDNLQTTVTENYPSTSNQQRALDTLNRVRKQCGFGLLNQNDKLDQAALRHAQYLVAEQTSDHQELNDKSPFFTAKDTVDRVKATGYSANALSAQIVTSTGAVSNLDHAADAVLTLLSAPYHLIGMMSGAREVGIAQVESKDVGQSVDATNNHVAFKMLLATPTPQSPQQQASNQIITYPCEGVTNAKTALFNETPNPIAGRDLDQQPIGQPILVKATTGQTISVARAEIARVSTPTTLVPVQILTKTNDPNAALQLVKSNEAIVMPLMCLDANTAYHVKLEGQRQVSSGAAPVAFEINFNFTTGVSTRACPS
jgi:uncharacterized protein YkwD